MLNKIYTATLQGLEAQLITIETDAYHGGPQPRFTIVGLPDNAVKESQERINAAIRHQGYRLPLKSVVVNLAPADIKKEGSGLDLPIAISLLAAHDLIDLKALVPPPPSDASHDATLLWDLKDYMFVGELGLDGAILPVRGALSIAIKARKVGVRALFVPLENVREAAVVNDVDVYGVSRIDEVIDFLRRQSGSSMPGSGVGGGIGDGVGVGDGGGDGVGDGSGVGVGDDSVLRPTVVHTREEFFANLGNYDCDFEEVRGQENVKRAFEVAAAGGHNIIIVGSPGCGKSMMAKRLPTILPPLTLAESLETTQIHSVAGRLDREVSLMTQRPFRAPHHTVSDVALVGGGSTFSPGEICLAHNGVLFLDELPEYSRSVLETLRQPLEDRVITISRARYNLTLPCSFMLVASMNPCPCGYLHHPTHGCTCTPAQIVRYNNRISGPLLDRIDIQVEVESVPFEDLADAPKGESSAAIRERVVKAREIQSARYHDHKLIHCNAQMTNSLMQTYAKLDKDCTDTLRIAMKRLNLSARAYDRIVKVARTIADLEGCENIQRHHIAEAIGYRGLDRGAFEVDGLMVKG